MPDAIAALQEAARLEPTSGEAHYQLGLALARAGRKDEASTELSKGRELIAAADQGQNATLDLEEGRAALDRGDFDTAVMKFRRASQLRPRSSDVQRYLGTALEKKGETEAAIAAYRQAVELNASDAEASGSLERLTKAATAAAGRSNRGVRTSDPRGEVRRGRTPARRVRDPTARLVVGLVRPRLQPVRAAEDRGVHQGARKISRARPDAMPKRTRFSVAT